jgi:hypothetical protein
LRELLATPRKESLGLREQEIHIVTSVPHVQRAEEKRPRPASAVPLRPPGTSAARPFQRPPNVPEVPLPSVAPPVAMTTCSDLDAYSSIDSSESPSHVDWPSSRRSGRGTRSGQGSQRSLELRAELVTLCQWALRRYRSGSDASAVLVGSVRTPVEHFAKALQREGYNGRPALAARAVDWRARGIVRAADLHALLDTDSDSTGSARSSHGRDSNVQSFFARNKGCALRPEPRPASAPTAGTSGPRR